MQRMVQALLALESLPRPDDAADGLALRVADALLGPNEDGDSHRSTSIFSR